MALLNKASSSVDLVKAALDAKTALATAEDKEKLADAKLALADLKELIADQKEENQKLKDALKKKEEFKQEKGVYWRSSDENLEQPFCPVCFSKERVVPLQKIYDSREKTRTPWKCPDESCKARLNPFDHKENHSVKFNRTGSLYNMY